MILIRTMFFFLFLQVKKNQTEFHSCLIALGETQPDFLKPIVHPWPRSNMSNSNTPFSHIFTGIFKHC